MPRNLPRNLAALRSEVEAALAGRVAAPFNYRDRRVVETAPTEIPEIDALTGGLPRGSLTEIYGPACSGRTTVLVAALAARTAEEEVCALVDGRDAFDPHSAAAAGVELEKLLWVRCQTVDQSLRAADLLIQGGGFGMVALDLCDFPPKITRQIPLNAWFHLRRAVEDTRTILLVLEQEAHAKTCASLVLRVGMRAAVWSPGGRGETREAEESLRPACARLLEGFEIHAEVVRSRVRSAEAARALGEPRCLPGMQVRHTGSPERAFGAGAFDARVLAEQEAREESGAKIFRTKPPWSIAREGEWQQERGANG